MRVLLTGFAGAGKTTVGRLVAEALGAHFVDMDAAVEALAGRPVAEIFAALGEPAFRVMERAVALEVIGRPGDAVVAAGGGTLLDPEVRRVALADCLVVTLHVGAVTAVSRIGESGLARPLVEGDAIERARELLQVRSGVYGLSHAGVQTEGRTPQAVAREVTAIARGHAVPVSLGARSHPVWLGRGLLAQVPALLEDAGLGGRTVALVCDRAVARRWGGALGRGLGAKGHRVIRVVQAPGEPHKTLRSVTRLYTALLRAGWERGDPVLALGGGMVNDLAGFVASTLLRGVPFIPLPTTLLAQADASVGGKVGVDHAAGKNLVGAFHQPRLVVADLDVLATLPARHVRAGLAEIVKCGVVRDERILSLLEEAAPSLRAGELAGVEEPLRRAIAVKATIVSRDEHEAGERRVLNFGHTVGHAIETVQRYRGLLHGEAVAVGMIAAMRLGQARGVTPPDLAQRVEALLVALGLPVRLPEGLGAEGLEAAMGRDKKADRGVIRVVLPAGGGRTAEVSVRPAEIVAALGA